MQSKQNIISANSARNQEGNAEGIRPTELHSFLFAGNLGSQAFAAAGTGFPLGARSNMFVRSSFGSISLASNMKGH